MTPSIYDWSTTEANNATADSGINWQEGQPPSTVNNSARYMMRRGKELLNDLGAIATAGGTANAITVAASSPFTAYVKGIRLLFKAASTNTAAATLNVNSIGAKNIVCFDGGAEQAIGPGFIVAGGLFEVVYDTALASGSGAWVLLRPGAILSGAQLKGYINGLTLANNTSDATNDIDFTIGACAADTTPFALMQFTSAMTKQLDATFVAGTNQGMREIGSTLADGWWGIYAIGNSTTGAADYLASASFSSPVLPSGYDRKRLIGAIFRTGGVIKPFTQYGDFFSWVTPVLDINTATPTTAGALVTLTVPPVLGVLARLGGQLAVGTGSAGYVWVRESSQVNVAATNSVADLLIDSNTGGQTAINLDRYVDASGQVRYRCNLSSVTYFKIETKGFRFPR